MVTMTRPRDAGSSQNLLAGWRREARLAIWDAATVLGPYTGSAVLDPDRFSLPARRDVADDYHAAVVAEAVVLLVQQVTALEARVQALEAERLEQ